MSEVRQIWMSTFDILNLLRNFTFSLDLFERNTMRWDSIRSLWLEHGWKSWWINWRIFRNELAALNVTWVYNTVVKLGTCALNRSSGVFYLQFAVYGIRREYQETTYVVWSGTSNLSTRIYYLFRNISGEGDVEVPFCRIHCR